MRSISESRSSGMAYRRLVTVISGLVALFVLECTVQALFFPSVRGYVEWWQNLFCAQCGLFVGLPVIILTRIVAGFPEPAKSLIIFPGAVLWSAVCFVGLRTFLLWFQSAEPAAGGNAE